jgi:hypothetical protein
MQTLRKLPKMRPRNAAKAVPRGRIMVEVSIRGAAVVVAWSSPIEESGFPANLQVGGKHGAWGFWVGGCLLVRLDADERD